MVDYFEGLNFVVWEAKMILWVYIFVASYPNNLVGNLLWTRAHKI